MTVWKGKGIVVPIVFMGIGYATMYIVQLIQGEEITQDNPLFFGTAALISGIILYFLGKNFNKNKDMVIVNKETGEQRKVGIQHSFSFVRVEWWGIFFVFLGIISIITLIIQTYFV